MRELSAIVTNSAQKASYHGKVQSDSSGLLALAVYAVLIFHALLTLYPLFWVIVNSFRDSDSIVRGIALLPESLDWSNYKKVISSTNIPRSFMNSLIICALSLALLLATVLPLAFALSRFRFRAAAYLHLLFSLAILVPGVSVLPMVFTLFNDLGLMGTPYGITLVYAAEQIPVSVFLLVAFMKTIPSELDEAAIMDGANAFTLFWRIIVPLTRNGIVTVLVLSFVAIWNDYITALILLPDEENRTLSVTLAMAKDEYRIDYGMMSAAIVFAVAPMLLGYLLLKNQLANGMAAGAVKG
jgi:raffinose/stachyose/melibiose transport system permease protein